MTYLISVFSVYTKLETLSCSSEFSTPTIWWCFMIGYSINFIYYPLQYLKKATSASQPHRSSFLFIHYFHFFSKPFHKNPETLLLYNIPYFQHPMSQMYYHFHLHLQTLFQILPQ